MMQHSFRSNLARAGVLVASSLLMSLLVTSPAAAKTVYSWVTEDGTYAFLFTAPPLPITGAVGSPINPLAIK